MSICLLYSCIFGVCIAMPFIRLVSEYIFITVVDIEFDETTR